jgi:hypothetical protein
MKEISRKMFAAALVVAAAALLAGCETDGSTPGPVASMTPTAKPAEPAKPEAAKPEEPKSQEPMTRRVAAEQCWMSTEKGSASMNVDKRADIVTKCIESKMKSAAGPKG